MGNFCVFVVGGGYFEFFAFAWKSAAGVESDGAWSKRLKDARSICSLHQSTTLQDIKPGVPLCVRGGYGDE